jgi:hypothetical protein
LLLLLLNRKNIKQEWDFIQLLEKERALCRQFQPKPKARAKEKEKDALYQYLDRLYAVQIAESTQALKARMETEYEKYADNLLQYEEEAHLMAYEIGLDMYQRTNQSHYREEPKTDAQGAQENGVVIYPFQGEFWNDELADLKVVLPNKCSNLEEWDVFFK